MVAIAGCSGHWNPSTDARKHEQVFGDKELGELAFRSRSATAACPWPLREIRLIADSVQALRPGVVALRGPVGLALISAAGR